MTTCYNPKHRLFFIHIPKCAGSAIGGEFNTSNQAWYGSWLDNQLTGWTRDGLPNGHQPVRQIEHFTGKPIEWWDKILVTIRNPFEQQLSQWKFWRKRAWQIIEKGIAGHADDKFALASTFPEFVMDGRSNGPNAYCGDKWQRCGGVYKWWVSDKHDRLPPNVHIIRVEDLPNAIEDVLRPYGVEYFTKLTRENVTDAADPLDHYTLEAAQYVARKFSWSLAIHYPGLADEMFDRISERSYIPRTAGLSAAV